MRRKSVRFFRGVLMQSLGGLLMEKVSGTHSFLNGRSRWLRTAGMSLLFTLAFSAMALSQDLSVSGTVTSQAGGALSGVTVRVQGTDTRAVTNASGKYFLRTPPD